MARAPAGRDQSGDAVRCRELRAGLGQWHGSSNRHVRVLHVLIHVEKLSWRGGETMAVERIQGDGRTIEARFCKRWLTAADELRENLFENGEGFDPLRYNETATVGFLVAAAGRARMLALPEFAENCRTLPGGRVRPGRCDLWLANEDWTINWLIEFKLNWFGPRSRNGLVTPLNRALGNAFDRDRQEARDRWGCVVYCPGKQWFDHSETDRPRWTAPETIEALALSVDLAFKFSSTAGPAYLLMKRVPPHARLRENCLLDADMLYDNNL
jgi:hypothetical protein